MIQDIDGHHGQGILLRIVDDLFHVAIAHDVKASIAVPNLGRAEFDGFDNALRAAASIASPTRNVFSNRMKKPDITSLINACSAEPHDEANDSGAGQKRHRIEAERRENQDGCSEIHA